MNDVQKTDDTVNIAAVVFMKMNDKRELVIGTREDQQPKPYFYLNIVGAVENDLCLVGSTGWNLVKVLRIIPTTNITALAKVTQPLLCRVTEYDPAKILDAGHKLLEFQLRTSEQRMQREIDRALMDELDDEIERVRNRRIFNRSDLE